MKWIGSHLPRHCLSPSFCHVELVDASGAYAFRETTGTSDLERTLRDAVSILAHYNIPHLVIGGLAVQECGYHRVTLDCDIVVPDVEDAAEMLCASLTGPFTREPEIRDTVKDKRNGVLINLLPAGTVLKKGCKVLFPTPPAVMDSPVFASLEKVISLKLDSWTNSPTLRLKDKADVVELIRLKRLPRDLGVDEAVKIAYQQTWDALAAEQALPQ